MQNKTAGELHNEIRNKPRENYSHLDLGYGISNNIFKGILECIDRHYDVFEKSVSEFCPVCILAPGEGGLKFLVRRKIFALPFLPTPCPNQAVWLFNKESGKTKFLWSLPTPRKMAYLAEGIGYSPEETRMKSWCNWYFLGAPTFWQNIRISNGISLLSESEFNDRNREAGCDYINDNTLGHDPDPLYLPEVRIKKLETVSNAAV